MTHQRSELPQELDPRPFRQQTPPAGRAAALRCRERHRASHRRRLAWTAGCKGLAPSPDEPPRMHASSRGGNDEQHTLILMLDDPLRKPADAGYSLQDSTEQLQQRLRRREVLSYLLLGRLQLNAVT